MSGPTGVGSTMPSLTKTRKDRDMAMAASSRIPLERRVRHEPIVYFIKPDRLEYVKIGVTRGIAQRLYELQHGCPEPLKLIASFPGWVEAEAKLHYTFIRYHSHGEWFRFGKQIKAFLEALNDPSFDRDGWLAMQNIDAPISDRTLKRYIGGKLQLGKNHNDFGHPKRKLQSGKLTEEAARAILENRWNMTDAELGRMYEVSRVMVGRIRKGLAWKHLRAA